MDYIFIWLFISDLSLFGFIISPSKTSIYLLASLATFISWVTIINVTFLFLCKSINNFRILLLVLESSDPVGSSANIIDGLFASARAIATLWRSPPDNLFG